MTEYQRNNRFTVGMGAFLAVLLVWCGVQTVQLRSLGARTKELGTGTSQAVMEWEELTGREVVR